VTIPVKCDECPLHKQAISNPEFLPYFQIIHQFRSGSRYLPPRAQIYVEGEPSTEVFTLFSGWAFRYKLLYDGRRQILDFLLPGDFTGLQGDISGTADHSVETITDVSLCVFRKTDVVASLRSQRRLAELLSRISRSVETVVYEHLVDVGRRSPWEATAHLLLELFTRLRNRDAVSDETCKFPLTQGHLADALGLSTAHVNRVLRQLREAQLVNITNGSLTILDYDGLVELCDFDSHYLVPNPVI
jgi:CRP-like cAMP-binding protein